MKLVSMYDDSSIGQGLKFGINSWTLIVHVDFPEHILSAKLCKNIKEMNQVVNFLPGAHEWPASRYADSSNGQGLKWTIKSLVGISQLPFPEQRLSA